MTGGTERGGARAGTAPAESEPWFLETGHGSMAPRTALDVLNDVREDLERRPRRHRAVAGLERPRVAGGRCNRVEARVVPTHAVVPPMRASSGDIEPRSSHSLTMVRSPVS